MGAHLQRHNTRPDIAGTARRSTPCDAAQSPRLTDQPARPRPARVAERQQRQRVRDDQPRRGTHLRLPDSCGSPVRHVLVPPAPSRNRRRASRRGNGRGDHHRRRARHAPADRERDGTRDAAQRPPDRHHLPGPPMVDDGHDARPLR